MQLQPATSRGATYSFETEDFEQWQLSSLNAGDDSDGDEDEYESSFDEESLAGNVIEFLNEVAARR